MARSRREDDEEGDERPRRRKREDDNDEDERPRRRKRDDEADRPKSRSKRKANTSGGPPWGLIAGGGGVLALVLVVVVILLILPGKKGGSADDKAGGEETAATDGGHAALTTGPGEMNGLIGSVDRLKPVVVAPGADAPGLAFRIALHEAFTPSQIVLPAQPSNYLTLVYFRRERTYDFVATVIDRRTGQPVGKTVDLMPNMGPPRPPFNVSSPDLSPDGTRLVTHVNSFTEKFNKEPLRVWNVSSGKELAQLRVQPNTAWQGWVTPDRLATVDGDARLDLWAYPAGTRTPGDSNGIGPAHPLLVIPESTPDGEGGTPRFAITGDHKRIALPRPVRSCFAILDTATGQEVGQTVRNASNTSAIAFSPDGSRLAHIVDHVGDFGSPGPALVLANGLTGVSTPPIVFKERYAGPQLHGNPLYWWGPKLLVYAAGASDYHVIDSTTGDVRAKIRLADTGIILPTTGDGRLWVKFDPYPFPARNGVYVCAFDPTPEILAASGGMFILSPDGIRPASK
jgi:hypothetical protein